MKWTGKVGAIDIPIDNKYAVVKDNGAKCLDEITITTVDYNP